MPVGLHEIPALLPVDGVRLGTAAAGVKRPGRRDLVLIELAPGGTCAALFTRNAFQAAPVQIARAHLGTCAPRFLLINTGNANAGTGEAGVRDAEACCDAVAALADCSRAQVLPFSTGVIGERLPVDRIRQGLPEAWHSLRADGWVHAAEGILTTDTVPKGVSRRVETDAGPITVTGIAKGSGMIHPDMATMLAFVALDAAVTSDRLRGWLRRAADASFHRITVDGDTSTNDACVLMATGRRVLPDAAEACVAVERAVTEVCVTLAQALVRDGEGATRFITVQVDGGRDEGECRRVADAVAHSPLVKTAFFAGDPNWGRILAAVGRAGIEALDLRGVNIHLDEVCIVRAGARAREYEEAHGTDVMARPEITVRVELGRGMAHSHVWTCDLSYEYVRINAEYRT